MPRKVQKILIRSLSNVRDAGLTTLGQAEVQRQERGLQNAERNKQVHLDNDVSEVDILGQIWTFCDNLEDFTTSKKNLDRFPSHFRPFSPIIGSLKKTCFGQTDGRTDGRADWFIIYIRYFETPGI